MIRLLTIAVALTLAGSAFAQSASQQAKSQQAVPAAAEPADVGEVPRNVQKWIGGAVDDILTGANKAVNPTVDKR